MNMSSLEKRECGGTCVEYTGFGQSVEGVNVQATVW